MTGEKDIIDEAMANDTYDYDNNTEATSQPDANVNASDDSSQSISSDLLPEQKPAQQVQKPEGTSLPGFKPDAQQQTQQRPQQQQRPDAQNPNGFKRVGPQFADSKGNIVDKDGKIIASAGQAARHWQEASRATAQVSNLTRQVQLLQNEKQQTTQLQQQAREVAELPQRLGLTREEFNESVTLASNWKKNPIEVAREIVARTLALGHNVTDILGKGVGDAVDMKALTHLVTQATAPIRQQTEQSARDTAAEKAAKTAHDTFVANHEYADIHGDPIANLMSKGRTPEQAYYQVRLFAVENGLDFSQPLGPQVDDLMRQRANGNTQQQNGERRPLPNGSGGGGGNSHQQTQLAAAAEDDWQAIIRSSM